MRYYTKLYTILYYTILYYTILHYTILYYAILGVSGQFVRPSGFPRTGAPGHEYIRPSGHDRKKWLIKMADSGVAIKINDYHNLGPKPNAALVVDEGSYKVTILLIYITLYDTYICYAIVSYIILYCNIYKHYITLHDKDYCRRMKEYDEAKEDSESLRAFVTVVKIIISNVHVILCVI